MASITNNTAQHQDRWAYIVGDLLNHAGVTANGDQPYDITVHDSRFYQRLLQQGSLGLGESYMDGWWDCPRLDIFFERVLRAGLDQRLPTHLSDIARVAFTRLVNRQSTRRAWIVGKQHYDLGNDLFQAMLDPAMQYSCAYWKDAHTLEEAQQAKLRLICEKLHLQPGMRLLDIGCGWGGLAEYAARNHGVSVVGVTISAEQQKLAQQRCQGLDIDIRLIDYRDLHDQFDRVVSVGMFEHVGPKNYATYFNVAARCLKEDGLFLLHSIGTSESYVRGDAWINRYIFPNGHLPSSSQLAQVAEKHFVMEDWHNFGADYDKTLMAWAQRFLQAWPQLSANYDNRFKRMFTYYLYSCAGSFRARHSQLWQVLYSPGGVPGGIRAPR